MKAISPVRSVRSCYKAVCCISEQSLAISRNKHSCLEEPVGALCDMNDCYSKLKELVPSIPQNKSVSQVEILQHVIDYIFDLQIALEAEDTAAPEVVLSIKTADLARNFSKEEGAGKHMSPLHSGQEDKRGRKGGIGIWERRRRRRRRRRREVEGFKKKKRQKKVDCFLDEWGSTVVHEQENRDSFFGPWTDKSTHQSRSQDWKLKATGCVCPPPKNKKRTWDPL